MIVRQISVFLENRPGRLTDVLEPLAQAGINLRAISIADTTDFGILRLMVDQVERGAKVLKEAGLTCTLNQVIAVEIPNKPGALVRVVKLLAEDGINVDYLYPFSRSALILLKTSDNQRAIDTLQSAGLTLVDEGALYTEGDSL